MSDILIQWMDTSSWVTTTRMDPAGATPAIIMMAMQDAQRCFPGKRIRAADDNGRVIDILY